MFIPDPGFWIWVFSISDPDSGSRGQNSSGSRIRNTVFSDMLILLTVLFCLIRLLC